MRLLLLRHAKSDRAAARTVEDHERPLNARGRAAAPRMGAYMAARHYVPQRVLCSSATRTRETLALVQPYLKPHPTIAHTRNLYLAPWPQLLAEIQKTSDDVTSLLLVGHNPGIEQLAAALAVHAKGPAERTRIDSMAEKFPTAALAVIDFDAGRWADVKAGQGRLVEFVRPKDLDGDDE